MRRRRSLSPFAIGAALAVLVGLGSAVPVVAGPAHPHASSAASPGIRAVSLGPATASLPACRYADVKTRFRSRDEWRHTLVDTERKVMRKYVPVDLGSVSNAHIGGSGQVRELVIHDLRAMARAARNAGNSIAVRSAYRSYQEQAVVFQMWVDRVGYQKALLTSARPGHSEHQLGTTIDFRSGDSTEAPWDYPDWAQTPAGAWMEQNAWKFGFVMSYPKGETSISCYAYEPWHYRYYGRSLAAQIHDSGLVPREYLWDHFESQP